MRVGRLWVAVGGSGWRRWQSLAVAGRGRSPLSSSQFTHSSAVRLNCVELSCHSRKPPPPPNNKIPHANLLYLEFYDAKHMPMHPSRSPPRRANLDAARWLLPFVVYAAAVSGAASARSVVSQRWPTASQRWPTVATRPRAPPAVASAGSGRVSISVDLGKDGEPPGVSQLRFNAKFERSEFIELNLRVPLGLVIEETGDGEIVITGALPGFSAHGEVEVGDLVRAVTAYREIVAGAPMWRQMMSYTPVGEIQRKRLIFRTEGATYHDVREAIASHRTDEGGDGRVTLLIERALNDTTAMSQPRDATAARLEPLSDVIRRDLQRKPGTDTLTEQVERGSAAERARRLLGVEPEER